MSVERYMVDDAGTLIDKVTRENYDTVEEVVNLLNHYENKLLDLLDSNLELQKDNGRLRMKIESLNENFNRLNKLFNEIEEPIDNEIMSEYMKIIRELI